MKPFFGIDLTENKRNEERNGSCFLLARPSSAMARALEDSVEKAEETIEQAKLPLALRIVQGLCGIASALLIAGLLGASVPLREAYRNAPELFWLAGICLPVWAILKLLGMQKSKAVMGKETSAQAFSRLDGTFLAVYAELEVPANAIEVDILSFYYKRKEGKIKVCEKGLQMAPYTNCVFRIFADAGNLYLANPEGKYAFPLSSLRAIQTRKKVARMNAWNKEEAFNKGIYKPYKLSADQYGCIHARQYHILELEQDGELWGIWFPSYELPAFEAVTGMKAQ